jgi:hypothetical protein
MFVQNVPEDRKAPASNDILKRTNKHGTKRKEDRKERGLPFSMK